MITIGDLFEKEKSWYIVDLLVQIDKFIQIYHEEMSREEFEAFQRVTEYIADIEVKE